MFEVHSPEKYEKFEKRIGLNKKKMFLNFKNMLYRESKLKWLF